MRWIGVDVHFEFCEVAIAEDGEVRAAGRIETKPAELELFARSFGAEDRWPWGLRSPATSPIPAIRWLRGLPLGLET